MAYYYQVRISLPNMRVWWNADTPHSKCGGVIRAGSSPAIRTSGKVEPGASVAAQFPKISKEVNGKEISR